MKALSGRQPWWWAILHAGKRVENRKWNTHYRGPILLHAAKGCMRREYVDAVNWMLSAGVVAHSAHVPPITELVRGGIVGRARIVDVIPAGSTNGTAESIAARHGADVRWWMPEQYGLILTDVEPMPFVPCNGALGLFNAPATIEIQQ